MYGSPSDNLFFVRVPVLETGFQCPDSLMAGYSSNRPSRACGTEDVGNDPITVTR